MCFSLTTVNRYSVIDLRHEQAWRVLLSRGALPKKTRCIETTKTNFQNRNGHGHNFDIDQILPRGSIATDTEHGMNTRQGPNGRPAGVTRLHGLRYKLRYKPLHTRPAHRARSSKTPVCRVQAAGRAAGRRSGVVALPLKLAPAVKAPGNRRRPRPRSETIDPHLFLQQTLFSWNQIAQALAENSHKRLLCDLLRTK
jgi:hypothetical protein